MDDVAADHGSSTRPWWRGWQTKALLQGSMSVLPGSASLNRVFQRRVTGSLRITPMRLQSKWDQTFELIRMWPAHDTTRTFRALEVGTGWLPIAPLALRAAGADEVISVDVQDLLEHAEVVATVERVADGIESGALAGATWDYAPVLRESLAAGHSSPGALLAACGVRVLVDDIAAPGLGLDQIDVTMSNNTLEHVPYSDMVRILRRLSELQAPGGVSVHFIDLKDHYAGFDPDITVYNFLRYSERRWRVFNNQLQWQNRLRASEYHAAFADAGLRVIAQRSASDPDALGRVKRHREFSRFSHEDLAVHSMWVALEAESPT
jgi:hypothetical protein